MPASPELRNRSRDVGVVEVAEILESHHAAKAYGHVRISRKVEVDLEGVGDDAGPSAHSANIRATLCEHEVGKYCHRVGKQRLLGESDYEEAKSTRKVG